MVRTMASTSNQYISIIDYINLLPVAVIFFINIHSLFNQVVLNALSVAPKLNGGRPRYVVRTTYQGFSGDGVVCVIGNHRLRTKNI